MNRRKSRQLTTLCIIILMFISLGLLESSCGNSSNGNQHHCQQAPDGPVEDDDCDEAEVEDNETENGPNASDDDGPEMVNIQLTGEIEQCYKCMGYGVVQDGLSGQPQICKFCWMSTYMRMQQGWTDFDGRYGQVDAVFNTLPADFFDGLEWTAEEVSDGGQDQGQIADEIARHEANITRLKSALESIEGTITRTQMEQQIIEEQYEIRRLQEMFNSME